MVVKTNSSIKQLREALNKKDVDRLRESIDALTNDADVIQKPVGTVQHNSVLVGKPTQPFRKSVARHFHFNPDIIKNKLRGFVDAIKYFDKVDANVVTPEIKKHFDEWLVEQMAKDIFSGLRLEEISWQFGVEHKPWCVGDNEEDIILKSPVKEVLKGHVFLGDPPVDDAIEVDVNKGKINTSNENSLVPEAGSASAAFPSILKENKAKRKAMGKIRPKLKEELEKMFTLGRNFPERKKTTQNSAVWEDFAKIVQDMHEKHVIKKNHKLVPPKNSRKKNPSRKRK